MSETEESKERASNYYCKKLNRFLTTAELNQHPCLAHKRRGKNKRKNWCNMLIKI
jgi:hypothetical protein